MKASFRYQTSSGTCGQRSLIHALLLLGHSILEKQALKACRVTRQFVDQNGTSETKLKRAINWFGYRCFVWRSSSRITARRFINTHLSFGSPIIISVQKEYHWAVLAQKKKDRYTWIDSADLKLIGHWSMTTILDWMQYYSNGKPEYYAIAIKPKKNGIRSWSRDYRVSDSLFGKLWGLIWKAFNARRILSANVRKASQCRMQ